MEKKPQPKHLGTQVLWTKLFDAPSLDKFMEKNEREMTTPEFHEFIRDLCEKRGDIPARVIDRADIDRSFGHQLFKGTRSPSRDTVLQLAFGFQADVELAQMLLKLASQSPLYPRVKRDAAIGYCLHNGYSLMEAQEVLSELGLPLIGVRCSL